MSVYTGEVITYARQEIDDTNALGRWSDNALINLLDRSSKRLMRDVMWPPTRLATQTVPNYQRYQMPVVLDVVSIYVNGQLCSPTDQRTIQGQQIDAYDQGLYGGSSTPQPTGGDGPSGTTGTFTPLWNIQTPEQYPVVNDWGWPRPDAQSWGFTQAPRYFWRGGYVVLIPAPANGPPIVNGVAQNNLVIDCVMLPITLTALTQPLWYNEHFVDALAWGVIWRAKFADATQTSAEQRNFARQEYDTCVRELRMWKANYITDNAQTIRFQTSRRFYGPGWRRSPWGVDGYP